MPEVKAFPCAKNSDGALVVADVPYSTLLEFVLSGNVAVLQSAAPKAELVSLRKAVHAWGKTAAAQNGGADDNHYAVESGVSKAQKTPHHFHAYNFNQLESLEPCALHDQLLPLFDMLRILWNNLTGHHFDYSADAQGRKFHPQIIHYPSGGGHFGKHIHALHPQQVGLILAISERGVDFNRGCTGFLIEETSLDTEETQDIGDITIFRYDVPHWIDPIDPEEDMREDSERGRWSMVLPYY